LAEEFFVDPPELVAYGRQIRRAAGHFGTVARRMPVPMVVEELGTPPRSNRPSMGTTLGIETASYRGLLEGLAPAYNSMVSLFHDVLRESEQKMVHLDEGLQWSASQYALTDTDAARQMAILQGQLRVPGESAAPGPGVDGHVNAYADVANPIAALDRAPRPSGTPQGDPRLELLRARLRRVQPVWAGVTTGGGNLIETLLEPLLDDYNRVAQYARLWEQVGAALQDIRANILAGLQTLDPLWRGEAAIHAETLLRDRWGAALTADAATARRMGAILKPVVETFQRIKEPAAQNIEQLALTLGMLTRLGGVPGELVRDRKQELTNQAVAQRDAVLQLAAQLRSAIEDASKNIRDLLGAGLALTRVADLRFGAPAHTVGPPAQPGLDDRSEQGTGGAYRVIGPDGREMLQLVPRRPDVPPVMIPNHTDADGFRVGPGWSIFDSAHSYFVPTPTNIPFNEQNRDLVGQSIIHSPVPNTDASPATPEGTRNDAYAGQYVRSYVVASPDPTRYTDIMVNYTIAGEHTLQEGYVMRYGEIQPDGTTRMVSYGEGNAFAQRPYSPLNPFNDSLWESNQADIQRRLSQQLGVPFRPAQ
jgi:hypothetical protein